MPKSDIAILVAAAACIFLPTLAVSWLAELGRLVVRLIYDAGLLAMLLTPVLLLGVPATAILAWLGKLLYRQWRGI